MYLIINTQATVTKFIASGVARILKLIILWKKLHEVHWQTWVSILKCQWYYVCMYLWANIEVTLRST